MKKKKLKLVDGYVCDTKHVQQTGKEKNDNNLWFCINDKRNN